MDKHFLAGVFVLPDYLIKKIIKIIFVVVRTHEKNNGRSNDVSIHKVGADHTDVLKSLNVTDIKIVDSCVLTS